MLTRLVVIILPLACLALGQEGPLLHYACDEGQGTVVADSSGHGLDATTGAAWAASPAGSALALDGTPATVTSLTLPEDSRFGRGSWTFSCWLKPTEFAIEDRQNQRRIFSYGQFPDGNLVIDLSADGTPTSYFCYKAADGNVVSSGAGSAMALRKDQWAHFVLVCDRDKRSVTIFTDGFAQGGALLPASFDGDYSAFGQVTFGSGWHNYWGLMDEITVWRRALSRAEVRADFERLRTRYGVEVSAEAAAAEKRQERLEQFAVSQAAWDRGDWAAVRSAAQVLIEAQDMPAALRSYASIRSAESYVAEGQLPAAGQAYRAIAANAEYPQVHRDEAAERASELARSAAGQPPRDPEANRTRLKPIATFARRFAVAPDGDDAADGQAAPVATLERSRDLVRAARAAGETGAIAVDLAPGEYRLTQSFVLSAEDSGHDTAGPTVYRSTQAGAAVLYGGQRLTAWAPVTDAGVLARLPEEARGQVYQCDLPANGVTDLGALAVRGFGQPDSPPTLEVFVDGQPMTLARWPNSGFVKAGELVAAGNRDAGQPSVLGYLDPRHERWTNAKDAWLFGYFRYLWADGTIELSKVDPATKTMTFDQAYQYGQPGMDAGQGIQYYAFNLLEEIDQPGEWYLDRATGRLYLWPPRDLGQSVVEVGVLAQRMVEGSALHDVRFEGLTFDLARFDGLRLENCQRVSVAGCTVKRLAGTGISVLGGEQCALYGCDLFLLGRRGCEVIGGDRPTLSPGQHLVENCRIYSFGRLDRTYTPAIQLEGVGNRVAHNLMYDAPSSVMRIEGNDHLMEYNLVHSAVRESDDQGAMELFGNPTYRGVVFRHNRFINCGKTGHEGAVHGQAAIRFDDAISGMLVYGNVFQDSANGNFGAIQINSGRDNVMDNNLFVDDKQGVSGGWNGGNNVWNWLREGRNQDAYLVNDLYLQRYPQMRTMLDPPGINRLWRNMFVRCGPMLRGNPQGYDLMANLEFDAAQVPADEWQAAAWQARYGLRPIPLDEIGLYADDYRATWPAAIEPVTKPDWRAAGGVE